MMLLTVILALAALIMSGLILSVLGIALLCWLLFTLAIQALPLYIGAVAATLAFQNGVGAVLAIIIGIVAAASATAISLPPAPRAITSST